MTTPNVLPGNGGDPHAFDREPKLQSIESRTTYTDIGSRVLGESVGLLVAASHEAHKGEGASSSTYLELTGGKDLSNVDTMPIQQEVDLKERDLDALNVILQGITKALNKVIESKGKNIEPIMLNGLTLGEYLDILAKSGESDISQTDFLFIQKVVWSHLQLIDETRTALLAANYTPFENE